MILKDFAKVCSENTIILHRFDEATHKWSAKEEYTVYLVDDYSTIVETYAKDGKLHVGVVDFARSTYFGLADFLYTVHDTVVRIKRNHEELIYLENELNSGCWVNTVEMAKLEDFSGSIANIYVSKYGTLTIDCSCVISTDLLRDAIDALVRVMGHTVILTYAQEILEPDFGEYLSVNDNELAKRLLNGANSWAEYSKNDSLVWAEDIAERFTGDKKAQPHGDKTWAEVQADYLYRACCLICKVAKAGR